jgi:hypothetical protein
MNICGPWNYPEFFLRTTFSSIMKMEAAGPSETFVLPYQTARFLYQKTLNIKVIVVRTSDLTEIKLTSLRLPLGSQYQV